jgi:hypothetical protein
MKIETLGRRVRFSVGRRKQPTRMVEEVPPPEPAPTEHEFIAYAEDCLLVGHIRLGAARLTDLLNDHDEYELVDVEVIAIGADRAIDVTTAVVNRDEILLVHATGPRGSRERRTRTRQHPVAMQLGPYHVRGYIHALPGSDPIASFRHRKPMVPLTDAWVEYQDGKVRQRRRVATLVVNRHQVDWVVEAVDDEVEMPDIPLTAEKGTLAKDFTGSLFGPSS